ncbi:hypothetical protein BIW11_03653 [Tropilaelaps mercedesae]|uniref:Uncharacterized protein n=1 Tax=Tropilaelaps mercedesae TaxID=418985 RepID=A0A1V9XI18_9ACAR|nr:hypothetical protein BIW11_03653 [Tropilaelaps mercedesae]
MSWRLRLMRNGAGLTIRRIGRACAKAAQALTNDLIRSVTEEDQAAPHAAPHVAADENEADDADWSGDGDRAESVEADYEDESEENSDTSTVGTSAKIRLRRRHKRRFLRSREDVYAHQYVYRILADAGIYQQPHETMEGECNQHRVTTFPLVETTLAVLRAMRTADARNRQLLMARVSEYISQDGPPQKPGVLTR